jgi:hypothetical protein
MLQGGRMTKNVIVFIMMSLFIFAPHSRAGVLLEPYLGFSIGSGDAGSTDFSYSTPTIGARAGYQTFGLMFGLDYGMQSGFNVKTTTSNVETKADYSRNLLGLFVGYELPILLRAWGTYYVSGTLEADNSTREYGDLSGYSLGVGFTGLPFVSLNAEYRLFDYGETTLSGATSNSSLSISEILLSVSLPFNL